MIAKAMLLLCAVFCLAEAGDVPLAVYGDQFKDRYPEVIDAAVGGLTGLPLEESVTVRSPQQEWTATVNRTNGGTVAYDQSLGRIEVRGEGQPTTVIKVHGFRTVTVTWINDRLLHINLGLGRIAAVDAIYDLLNHRWLYQESISYTP